MQLSDATRQRRTLQSACDAGALLSLAAPLTCFRAPTAASSTLYLLLSSLPPCCRISEFLQTAQKKLSYLRIVTPKAPGDDEDNSRGVSRYVVAGDKVVNLAEAGKLADADGKLPSYLSSFREGNLDPDAVRRHEAQLRRVRFMDRGMPAPVSPWQR